MIPRHDTRLVIFDCDGVLIDSEYISAAILIEELCAINIEVDFDYVLTNFLGRSFSNVAAEIRGSFNSTLPDNFEKNYRIRLLDEFKRSLITTDGVREVLQDLNVTACVATSSSPIRVARSLELVNLKKYFGANVFTAYDVKRGKPAPDLFLHAAQAMQVSPENCLVIEDTLYGIQAAVSAGMDVMRYMGASHYSETLQIEYKKLSTTAVIDHWSKFYNMKPELKKLNNRR